jgi:hypothetical protein
VFLSNPRAAVGFLRLAFSRFENSRTDIIEDLIAAIFNDRTGSPIPRIFETSEISLGTPAYAVLEILQSPVTGGDETAVLAQFAESSRLAQFFCWSSLNCAVDASAEIQTVFETLVSDFVSAAVSLPQYPVAQVILRALTVQTDRVIKNLTAQVRPDSASREYCLNLYSRVVQGYAKIFSLAKKIQLSSDIPVVPKKKRKASDKCGNCDKKFPGSKLKIRSCRCH